MNLLLVEDEAAIAESLAALLRSERYEVRWAADLAAARAALAERPPDLLILDVMLPEGEDAGFALARELRAGEHAFPILFLSARDTLDDLVMGLDLGADDYLAKPFRYAELSARVRALLRRQGDLRESRFERGPLALDLASRAVRWRGEPVALSDREFAMLELFCLYPERRFSAEALLGRLFPEAESGLYIVRVYVHHLRQKLAPEVIETVPGGYRLGLA